MYYAEHPFPNQGCNDYVAKFTWWMLKQDALGPSGYRYFHLWQWLLLLTPSSQHGFKFNGSKTQFIDSVQILWVKSNTRKYYSFNWIAWRVQPQLHSWSRGGYSCLFWKDFNTGELDTPTHIMRLIPFFHVGPHCLKCFTTYAVGRLHSFE